MIITVNCSLRSIFEHKHRSNQYWSESEPMEFVQKKMAKNA